LLGERDPVEVVERRRRDRPGEFAGRREIACRDRPAGALEQALVAVGVELAGERDLAEVVQLAVVPEQVVLPVR